MVTILAIEQLTGVQKAPAVSLSGSAVVGAAELAAKYTDLTVQTRQQVVDAETKSASEAVALAMLTAETKKQDDMAKAKKIEVATVQTKYDQSVAPGSTATQAQKDENAAELKLRNDELTKIQADLDKATETQGKKRKESENAIKDLENKKELLAYYESARTAALSGSGSSSMTVQVVAPVTAPSTSAAMESIAKSVEAIVKENLGKNFSLEACASVINAADLSTVPTANSVLAECLSYLKLQAVLDSLEEGTTLTTEQFNSLVQ
jgi:hypothetical protein